MFVAPLVPVLLILAIPLWPVAIAAVSLIWLVTWPLEAVCRLLHLHLFQGASRQAVGWLHVVLRPWILFEPRRKPPTT